MCATALRGPLRASAGRGAAGSGAVVDALKRGRVTQAARRKDGKARLAHETQLRTAHDARLDALEQRNSSREEAEKTPKPPKPSRRSVAFADEPATPLSRVLPSARLLEARVLQQKRLSLSPMFWLESAFATGRTMSTAMFIDAQDFDHKLLCIELYYTKPMGESAKPKTSGNWGFKFGPDTPEKAVFMLGLPTARYVDADRVARFFDLPQLDAGRQPLAEGNEIRHEDVLMAAVHRALEGVDSDRG
ncbi:hypothetical protein T492DRAFT_871068 [Pavlovales sp. CCMP2436]|nr:hypothetical protein T492DRAFT_871068 [Pavlovales sp. CCMP2436]